MGLCGRDLLGVCAEHASCLQNELVSRQKSRGHLSAIANRVGLSNGREVMNADKQDAYTSAGVDYEPLDRFKRLCQVVARETVDALKTHGLSEPEDIRGESSYLIEAADCYWAHVEEGLGTKNLIADAWQTKTGVSAYQAIGIDTVAAIVNDLLTCGALPVVVAMHAGVGDDAWFGAANRGEDLANGFAEGCRQA